MNDRPDRPLVSFALFGFNQEKFIREAVQGAFAQTYEPLEIILSDDCSTDRTFEIMQEMAAAYEGHHDILLNKTTRNLGVVAHVIEICRNAKGAIIVVAAGDDISYMQRVETIVDAFKGNPETFCVTTGFDLIDDDGALLSSGHLTPVRTIKRFVTLPAGESYIVIQGSTAAYKRELFTLGFPNPLLPCSEDNLLNFMIYANQKRVMQLPLSLVAYRQHQRALANYDQKRLSLREAETLSMDQHISHLNLLSNMQAVADACSAPERISRTELEGELCNMRERVRWRNLSARERLAGVLRAVRSRQFLQLRWQLPRLWGQHPDYPALQYVHMLKSLLGRRA